MRILVSGASGFIGSSLISHFLKLGFDAVSLKNASNLEGFDAFVHLAGEPLSIGRWSQVKQNKIRNSRVEGTQSLCRTLLALRNPPKVFIAASAVGYYGDRGEELLRESAGAGKNFLSNVCQEWEKASLPLAERGVRVIHARFGIVLGPQGGVFKKLYPIYRLGLGATLGSGSQWISWIALADLVEAICHIIAHPGIQGPINMVSPHPVRQKEFASVFAQSLSRPQFLAIPKWLLETALGLMAQEMLLASQRADAGKLRSSGFQHRYPFLRECLEYCRKPDPLPASS